MITICIATFGDERWRDLAWSHAYPSASRQGAEVIINHDEHGSLASVRNAAARAAHGEWLIFLDADDQLAPQYVGAMEAALGQRRATALYLPRTSFTRGGSLGPPHFFKQCSLRDGNPLIIGTMVPRALFLDVGGFDEGVELFEDWMLFAKLWKAGAPVINVPDAVYIAYMHRNSRNRIPRSGERLYWHQFIGHAVFPEYYAATEDDEDHRRQLRGKKIRLVA